MRILQVWPNPIVVSDGESFAEQCGYQYRWEEGAERARGAEAVAVMGRDFLTDVTHAPLQSPEENEICMEAKRRL
jgi:hypothetical protein